MSANNKRAGSAGGGGGGAFLTQKGEKASEVKNEISELEQLLAAAGQTSQSTLLLKKRKEMREVDFSLDNMKKQHKQRMDACEERRLQFELKQAKMREQVLRFEKFIQENDAKRQRAENKAKQERKQYEDKVKEIKAKSERIEQLAKEQQELNELLVKNSRYKNFLEDIVGEGDRGYDEISEILNRHATLTEANRDLMEHSAQLERDVDELRRKLQSLKTEKQNHVLVSTSIIQEQQDDLERMKLFAKAQEEDKLQVEGKKKDMSKELSQITAAIKNLYVRCFNTMRIKPVFQGQKDTASLSELLDFELDIILMRIADLVDVVADYKNGVTYGDTGAGAMTGSVGELKEGSIGSLQSGSKSIS